MAPTNSEIDILYLQSEEDPNVNGQWVFDEATDNLPRGRWTHIDNNFSNVSYIEEDSLWYINLEGGDRYFTAFDNWFPPEFGRLGTVGSSVGTAYHASNQASESAAD